MAVRGAPPGLDRSDVASARHVRARSVAAHAGWWLGALLCFAVLAVLLVAAARRAVAGNSDGATVILEGQAMLHGAPLLSGWTLSLDSFWTLDALANTVAIAVVGLTPQLLVVLPALIAALTVVVGATLAGVGERPRVRLVAAAGVIVLLLPQSRAFAEFFLQGALHSTTILACLLGFWAFRQSRFGLQWALGVVILSLTLLGDFETLAYGVLPVFLAGATATSERRAPRARAPLMAGAVASVLLAGILHEIARAIGTFALAKRNPFASGHQVLRNLRDLPSTLGGLLGVITGPYGASPVPQFLRIVHVGFAAILLAGVVIVAAHLLGVGRTRTVAFAPAPQHLERMLFFAVLADGLTYVIFPIITSPSYGRYLVPAIVDGAVLAMRTFAPYLAVPPRSDRRRLLLGAVAVGALAISFSTFGEVARGPNAPQPAMALGAFLSQRRLTVGIGDYWSASIVTVESGGDVAVRPVIADDQGRIVRYGKQSASSWYSGVPFQFFVFNAGAIFDATDASAARRTFGRPNHVYAVGSYRILTWPHPVSVSVEGSQGPGLPGSNQPLTSSH